MDSMKFRIRLQVLGIFAFGVLCGVLPARMYYATRVNAVTAAPAAHRTAAEDKLAVMDAYSKPLNMTADQLAQMSKILDETTVQADRLRQEVRPRFDDIRSNARARIRAMLTAEQQPRFDELVRERDAKRQQANSNNK